MTDQSRQPKMAAKALAKKPEPDQAYLDRQEDTAAGGPLASRHHNEPVMGAFDAEGHRPVLERSRKVR